MLSGYADGAVLHFNEGPHRWSGAHTGKPAIERFYLDTARIVAFDEKLRELGVEAVAA